MNWNRLRDPLVTLLLQVQKTVRDGFTATKYKGREWVCGDVISLHHGNVIWNSLGIASEWTADDTISTLGESIIGRKLEWIWANGAVLNTSASVDFYTWQGIGDVLVDLNNFTNHSTIWKELYPCGGAVDCQQGKEEWNSNIFHCLLKQVRPYSNEDG